jgi:hypothetical protein
LIAVSVGLILYSSRVKNSQNGNPEQSNSENLSSGRTPNLPAEASQSKAMQVENANDPEQVKNSYNNYVEQGDKNNSDAKQNGISSPYTPADKNVNLVPLDAFLGSVGASVNSNVKSIAGKNYYSLFYCISEKQEKEYGFVLDMSEADAAKTQVNIRNVESYMLQWEPYMLKDLHNILLPSMNLNDETLNQILAFKKGKYQYADVNLPEGKKSINYTISDFPLNLIIISTSPECIDKAVGMYSALD